MDELENEVGLVFPCTVIRSSPLLNYLEKKEKCAFILMRKKYVLISKTTCSTLREWIPWTNTLLGIYKFCISGFKKETIPKYK